MKTVRPDFYDDFKCIADKCRHSCCIGWEIDIDSDSYEYYMGIEGKLGEDLRKNISADSEPHFCLCENERCPFLECNGLCRLINELGEESLCDICAEHPRFYNYFDDREEMGLGLSCEEVARLLKGHNNANIIALPGRFINTSQAIVILRAWIATEFMGGRHQERLQMIENIEKENMK